jgi:tetrahydromethanopterin S-methyltransferase subunit D
MTTRVTQSIRPGEFSLSLPSLISGIFGCYFGGLAGAVVGTDVLPVVGTVGGAVAGCISVGAFAYETGYILRP